MEVNKGKFYKIKWFWNILNNGLLLFGVRNRLARIGFDINPFYWVQEGDLDCDLPNIAGDPSEFELVYLKPNEFNELRKKIVGYKLNSGDFNSHNHMSYIGLKHKGEIAAFMIIVLGDFNYHKKVIRLNKNEAYLTHMYTFEEHRGKNLAPYLRYQSYLNLRDQGKDMIYSITQYFNTSSKRFKRKLNARNLQLYMYIILFKKYHYHFLLRNYDTDRKIK